MNNLPDVTHLCHCGNRAHNLLIASPTPYRYATVPPVCKHDVTLITALLDKHFDAGLLLLALILLHIFQEVEEVEEAEEPDVDKTKEEL